MLRASTNEEDKVVVLDLKQVSHFKNITNSMVVRVFLMPHFLLNDLCNATDTNTPKVKEMLSNYNQSPF